MSRIQPQVEHEFNSFNRRCLPESTLSCDHSLVKSRIGQLISQRLEENGKAQRWLAEQVGVSDNAVSKWIKTGKVNKKNALKVSELLDIPVAVLLSDDSAELLPSSNTKTTAHQVNLSFGKVMTPAFDEPRRWPFSPEIHDRIMRLGPIDLADLESVLEHQLGLVEARLSRAGSTDTKPSKRVS